VSIFLFKMDFDGAAQDHVDHFADLISSHYGRAGREGFAIELASQTSQMVRVQPPEQGQIRGGEIGFS